MVANAGSNRSDLAAERHVGSYMKQASPPRSPRASPPLSRSGTPPLSRQGSQDDVIPEDFLPIPRDSSTNSGVSKEASECAVCGIVLGKRRMRPRHHCRICFRAVCSTCSPNWIQFEKETTVQRVCVPCGLIAQKAPGVRARLEKVADVIRNVNGPAMPTFSFPETLNEINTGWGRGNPESLEDVVTVCEMHASSLKSLFDSHAHAKYKISEVEAEAAEQRQTCERLERVAQRVGDVENEVAQERQVRIQCEAKVRHAKISCATLAERIHVLTGSQASSRPDVVSLEDALVDCDAAIVKLEAIITEDRRAKKDLEFEKNESLMKKERTIAVLQAEVMKLRADAEQERKLRVAFQDSVLQSTASSGGKRSAHNSNVLPDSESSERILFQGGSTPPSLTPPRMNSVYEDSTTDATDAIRGRACFKRDVCAVM